MLKTLSAITFAAVVAGAITGFPGIDQVSATSTAGVEQIAAPTCPNRGWPYRDCVEGTSVRLITTDRLH
ncbi:MAG: hypothetical protein JO254_15590 [Pseudolabrys sp.]|nr:hypothetical protein [Pseudolabrys sp.]